MKKSISQNFKDVSIRIKIGGGFALLILFIGVFLFQVLDGFSKKDMNTQMIVQSFEVRLDMLQARRAEKDFLLHKDIEYVEKNAVSIKDLKHHLQSLIFHHARSGVEKKLLADLKKVIHTYENRFSEMVTLQKKRGLNENAGIRGEFRNATHLLETAILERGLPAEIRAQLLMCRRREKDYMLRGAEKYIVKLAADVASLKDLLIKQGASDLLGLLDAYQEKFLTMTEIDQKISKNIATFREAIHQVDPILKKVVNAAGNSADNLSKAFIRSTVIEAVMLIFIGIFISMLLIRIVTRPIIRLSNSMNSLGEGDLTHKSGIDTEDEIGKMAQSSDNAVDSLNTLIKNLKEKAETLLGSSRRQSAVTVQIAASTEEMSSQAANISAASEEASTNLTSIAASTEEMSASVSTVATAVEEMSATVNEISKNCQKESEMAESANAQAGKTTESMKKLEGSANEIGKVLEVINDIADQTNLLALNATIEAASAGEAGKGFAVVANEIKELAKQTAQATDEIWKQITDIRSNTDVSVKATADINIVIDEVNTISQIIVSAVEEQSATINEISNSISGVSEASNEVARNVQESAGGLNEISENISGFSQAIDEITKGMGQVEGNAVELRNVAESLEKSVSRFKV